MHIYMYTSNNKQDKLFKVPTWLTLESFEFLERESQEGAERVLRKS